MYLLGTSQNIFEGGIHPGAILKYVLCGFYSFFEYLIYVATMESDKNII